MEIRSAFCPRGATHPAGEVEPTHLGQPSTNGRWELRGDSLCLPLFGEPVLRCILHSSSQNPQQDQALMLIAFNQLKTFTHSGLFSLPYLTPPVPSLLAASWDHFPNNLPVPHLYCVTYTWSSLALGNIQTESVCCGRTGKTKGGLEWSDDRGSLILFTCSLTL